MALDAIVAHKRTELAERRARTSLESLLARAEPSRKSFSAALRHGSPGFVLEIKFASPSAGVIRAGADLEPVLLSYGRHADAVSVLTDERFFGGSLNRLAEVRQRLVQPLLAKDFFLEPYQVAEARVYGADAILLILAALDDATWHACAELAGRLGMEVLTEVHDAAEAERAVALGAKTIGINNRDLRTLRVDREIAPRLAPRIPRDRLLVAESGYASREDVTAASPVVDAFLVGGALMGADDLDAAVRELVYGRTKVCGLTRSEDAMAAAAAGATHGGLIFAEGSPRRVRLDAARAVRKAAPLRWVGVFADQSDAHIAATARELDLAAVQLHGGETPESVAAVRKALPAHCEVWKAVRVTDRLPRRTDTGADRVLLDGPATSQRFDWELLTRYPERPAVVLAGGLRPENVTAAAALGTYAIDVSSGVESGPGEKDAHRITAFLHARRRLPGRGIGSS